MTGSAQKNFTRIEELCAKHGLRMTGQRRIIAHVLSQAHDHPDVDAVYKRANSEDPRISLSTVYRTLKLFEQKGILERHDFGRGRGQYEEASTSHHDHLIDVETGRVIEFSNERHREAAGSNCARTGVQTGRASAGALWRTAEDQEEGPLGPRSASNGNAESRINSRRVPRSDRAVDAGAGGSGAHVAALGAKVSALVSPPSLPVVRNSAQHRGRRRCRPAGAAGCQSHIVAGYPGAVCGGAGFVRGKERSRALAVRVLAGAVAADGFRRSGETLRRPARRPTK